MTEGKPGTLRGLILYNAQAICEVYKQKTFSAKDLFDEVVKDRPSTSFHSMQTSVSKDMLNIGYFEKVGKTTPSVLRLSAKGVGADPHEIIGYDTVMRRKKKVKEFEEPKKHVEKKAAELKEETEKNKSQSAFAMVSGTVHYKDALTNGKTKEERFSFVDDVVERITSLKREVELWEWKYLDRENKIKNDIAQIRAQAAGKEKVIAELNQKIIALSNRLRRGGGEGALREAMQDWQEKKNKQQTG